MWEWCANDVENEECLGISWKNDVENEENHRVFYLENEECLGISWKNDVENEENHRVFYLEHEECLGISWENGVENEENLRNDGKWCGEWGKLGKIYVNKLMNQDLSMNHQSHIFTPFLDTYPHPSHEKKQIIQGAADGIFTRKEDLAPDPVPAGTRRGSQRSRLWFGTVRGGRAPWEKSGNVNQDFFTSWTWRFPARKMGKFQNAWSLIMEDPSFEMDDDWGSPYDELETTIWAPQCLAAGAAPEIRQETR